jgi:AI-2E family transporter
MLTSTAINTSLERRGTADGVSATQPSGWLRDHSSRIITSGIVLALLYLGRSVLIPLALAIMLSLLVAPLIRALRRLRIGRTSSVLFAVSGLTVLCVAVAAALGTQVLHIAESLPQYESNVQRKLNTLEEVIVGPILTLTNETSRLTGIDGSAGMSPVSARDVERSPPDSGLRDLSRRPGARQWTFSAPCRTTCSVSAQTVARDSKRASDRARDAWCHQRPDSRSDASRRGLFGVHLRHVELTAAAANFCSHRLCTHWRSC